MVIELCEYRYIRSIYLDCKIDVQPCRSKKSCLQYVHKSDVEAYTNVKSSLLHFNFRCYGWTRKSGKFDCTDPFVVEDRFNYTFFERYLLDFNKNNLKYFKSLRKYEGECYDGWMLECVEWYDNVIQALDCKYKVHKRQQLFIVGPINVGKSSLVEKLIGRQNLKYVYYAGIGKFACELLIVIIIR